MTAAVTTAESRAATILRGRREGALLALPSVQRMADVLAARCRERSWVRTSVASLERFRVLAAGDDLEALLARARAEPAEAERALGSFAVALGRMPNAGRMQYAPTEGQVAALAMGPKIWFRVNGVAIPWRPLPKVDVRHSALGVGIGPGAQCERQTPNAERLGEGPEGLILLALIGSGLYRAELLRLRLGDVGSLDAEGRLVPDIEAEPLAVQYMPRRGRQGARVTFLTYQARQALLADVARRTAAGQPTGPDAPLIACGDGSGSRASNIARARRRSASLIHAGNAVNVELCLATGNFFRAWGLPGSRFVGPEELNIEEYV
jgi:hypothetical protein